MKTIHAVAGIVRRGDDVLVVERSHADPHVEGEQRDVAAAGASSADAPPSASWEFPAGNVRRGETSEQACERVFQERLKVSITDLRDFYTVEYGHDEARLSMECYFCELAQGSADESASASEPSGDGVSMGEEADEPAASDASDVGQTVRWVPRRSLATLSWAPEDEELVRVLSSTEAVDDAKLVKRRADSRKSMQGNKRSDTKPEMLVRQRLREAGLPGYRLQWKKVPGTPDIAYPGRKVAIFVNGCYWHRCPYCKPAVPKRNTEFWEAKFKRNVERDEQVQQELGELGWTTIVIWECQLKPAVIDATMERVIATVRAAKKP